MKTEYNGWNEKEIIIALENIVDDFMENDLHEITSKLKDTTSELDRAFINGDIYINALEAIAMAITEADNADMIRNGDTLYDIMIALKTGWIIDTE